MLCGQRLSLQLQRDDAAVTRLRGDVQRVRRSLSGTGMRLYRVSARPHARHDTSARGADVPVLRRVHGHVHVSAGVRCSPRCNGIVG